MFHARSEDADPRWSRWLQLPAYAVRRLPMTLRLLRPFLRHPWTSAGNVRYLRVRDNDAFRGVCLGVPSRLALLERIRQERDEWRAGRRAERPQVWIFQAYCEKPLRCACAPDSGSPYAEPDAQRRFNAGCVLAEAGPGRRCGAESDCRVGQTVRRWEGTGDGLDVRVRIMLSERQMADFWAEMLDHQARTGTPIPFVMDVCPMALWLAQASLFRLKTPVGVVFLFESPHRCKTFAEYRSADAGRKSATAPVTLSDAGQAEKAEFLRQLAELADLGG